MLKKIEIIPIYINININPKVKLLNTLLESVKNNNQIIKNGDILVIAQKIISKNEGRSIYLNNIIPSPRSIELGRKINGIGCGAHIVHIVCKQQLMSYLSKLKL